MNLGYKTTHTGTTSCGCGNKGGSVCDPRNVKSISRVGENVIIAFDDCTYIAAPITVLDTASLCGSSNTGETPTPSNPDNGNVQTGDNNVIMSLGGEIIDSAAQGGSKPPTSTEQPQADGHEYDIE